MATTRARRILQSDENIPFNESHRSLGSREGLSKLFLASLGAVEKNLWKAEALQILMQMHV